MPPVTPIAWKEDCLWLLDQRLLPHRVEEFRCERTTQVAEAIREMVVRGAPAIGIAAAYGVVLAAREAWQAHGEAWRQGILPALEELERARPTAVNLAWALARMRRCFDAIDGEPELPLLAEARAIHEEDVAANRHMGELGAKYLQPGARVLTHCNAGALATGGHGTALGVVRSGWAEGKIERVYADETRPWLQGARLTAWELLKEGIPVTLLAEGAAAWLMKSGRVEWVIVGADRITANGDVANKIGTLNLAIIARRYGVRMMVVAPISTIDPGLADGNAIPIEERPAAELLELAGRPIAASGAGAWNPVFDVTPAELVDLLVTEHGALERPDRAGVTGLLERAAAV